MEIKEGRAVRRAITAYKTYVLAQYEKGLIKKKQNNKKRDNNLKKKEGTCYNYGKPGHQVREYRGLKKEIHVLQKGEKKEEKKEPRTKKGLRKKEPKKLLAIIGRGGYNSGEDEAKDY